LKGINAGANISITDVAGVLTINASGSTGVNSVTGSPSTGIVIAGTATNPIISSTIAIGSAGGTYSLINSNVLPSFSLKGINAGANISITDVAGVLTINASGSVGVNSVSGSPSTGIVIAGTATNPIVTSTIAVNSTGGTYSLIQTSSLPTFTFKSINSGTNINITESAGILTINASGSIGVNSVTGSPSTGIVVTGTATNPIVTSTIAVNSTGGTHSLIQSAALPTFSFKSINAGTNVTITESAGILTINSSGSSVNLSSAPGSNSLVYVGTAPNLQTKALSAGSGISITDNGFGNLTISASSSPASTLVTGLYVPSWSQYWYANAGGRPNIPLLNSMTYTNQNCFFLPPQHPDIIYFAFIGFSVDLLTDAVAITELTLPDSFDLGDFNQINGIASQNEKSIKVASLGGFAFTSVPWQNLIANATRINNFATAVNNFLLDKQIQGIDIDWEQTFPTQGPSPINELIGLSNIITALITINPSMYVSLAVPSNVTIINNILNNALPGSSAYCTAIKANITYINMMTYDIHGSWETTTAPTAGIPEVSAIVDDFIATGTPLSKLMMGIPFYSRGWTTTVPGTSPHPANPYGQSGPSGSPEILVSIEEGLANYAELVALQYFKDPSSYNTKAVTGYDVPTHSAYMWYVPNTQIVKTGYPLPGTPNWVLMSYDNEDVVVQKMALAKSKGIGGVYAWHIAADTFYRSAPLWNAVCQNK
jgi:GH18 family chitinase